jgi:chorismate-pyruvate lyase
LTTPSTPPSATADLLWPSPQPIWQATAEEVVSAVSPRLSGPWRLLLLGDGSPTRHLQSLTGIEVTVEVIAMAADTNPGREAPVEVAELDQPLLRRQVWLRCGAQTLAWAESWWNQQEAEQHLKQRNQPIWRSLTAERAELYREVDGLALVEAPALQQGFGREGPYWSRHYRFFRGGRELTVIREVFSPQLEHWLGPAAHTAS